MGNKKRKTIKHQSTLVGQKRVHKANKSIMGMILCGVKQVLVFLLTSLTREHWTWCGSDTLWALSISKGGIGITGELVLKG